MRLHMTPHESQRANKGFARMKLNRIAWIEIHR